MTEDIKTEKRIKMKFMQWGQKNDLVFLLN